MLSENIISELLFSIPANLTVLHRYRVCFMHDSVLVYLYFNSKNWCYFYSRMKILIFFHLFSLLPRMSYSQYQFICTFLQWPKTGRFQCCSFRTAQLSANRLEIMPCTISQLAPPVLCRERLFLIFAITLWVYDLNEIWNRTPKPSDVCCVLRSILIHFILSSFNPCEKIWNVMERH